jgi:uncharacterized protein (TIGR02301 family)
MSLKAFRPAVLALVALAAASAGAPRAHAQEGPPLDTLVNLATLLGRAHAVRSACNGDADQTWRNYMFNMLAIEAPSGSPKKQPLTSAFNRGFRDQQNRTGKCTADMPRLEAEIAAQGRAVAETVASSYLR